MRRGIHIAVTLLAIVALIRPFDCFAASVKTHEAAACCLKGECHPGANADDCCKNTVPDSAGLTVPAVTSHHVLVFMGTVADSATLIVAPVFQRLTDEHRNPPPRPSLTTVSLPLLI